MTRKDYVLIAAALKAASPLDAQNGLQHVQHRLDCNTIANRLAADNPRFDHARFLAECGVAS